MHVIKKSNLGLITLLFVIIVSYIFGFYLNEDSAGGGKSRLYWSRVGHNSAFYKKWY